MAIRTAQNEAGIYFCTFTCFSWVNLFDITNLYDHINKWLNDLDKKDVKTCGYVIMPNHLHVLLNVPERFPQSINRIIGNAKRFMSYEIVVRLKAKENLAMLEKMARTVPLQERAKGKLHQVFEPSFDAKNCDTEKFLLQKLDYIHHNPVNGKWNLAEDYVAYPYSSAKFYETGIQNEVFVTHYSEVF